MSDRRPSIHLITPTSIIKSSSKEFSSPVTEGRRPLHKVNSRQEIQQKLQLSRQIHLQQRELFQILKAIKILKDQMKVKPTEEGLRKLSNLEAREKEIEEQIKSHRETLMNAYKELKQNQKAKYQTNTPVIGNKPQTEFKRIRSKASPSLSSDVTTMFKDPLLEFSIDDDEAADLSNKLMQVMLDAPLLTDESEKQLSWLVLDFAVKSDLNKSGLEKAKKEKLNSNGKKVYQMEDQSLISCPFDDDLYQGLFAVFDGHVDKNAAICAKEYLPTTLSKYLQSRVSKVDVKDTLKNTFHSLDEQLFEFEYEGCTATVVYIWNEGEKKYVQAANVGDSSAYLYRAGECVPLTKDHKVTDPDEQQRLRNIGLEISENQTHLNGLAVSRSLGDHFMKRKAVGLISEPFISPSYELKESDTHIVIASDGLWDVISGKKAGEIIQNLNSASEMAQKLLNLAISNPKCQDNVTVIVICL